MTNSKDTMYFQVECEKCDHKIELPENRKGDWVKCKKCSTLISVPITGLHLYPTPKGDQDDDCQDIK